MKQSISYLPKRKQDDIHYLVKAVLEKLPETQMIILYGSYATGKYVDYDERVEFGIRTSYMSDYDILVVTNKIRDKEAGQRLNDVENKYYTDPGLQTPVQFINEDIRKLNKDLSEGRYFYTQVKKEGILLYDSKNFKLARRHKLNYMEIGQQAEEYFKEKYQKANFFFDDAMTNAEKGRYQMSSFYLHQVCENLFQGIRLTYILKNFKQHNLDRLLAAVRTYSTELTEIFPRKTAEEQRLFKLLKSAYVEARYNPGFSVTKKDIDVLIPKVELLKDVTKRICEEKIEAYKTKMREGGRGCIGQSIRTYREDNM